MLDTGQYLNIFIFFLVFLRGLRGFIYFDIRPAPLNELILFNRGIRIFA